MIPIGASFHEMVFLCASVCRTIAIVVSTGTSCNHRCIFSNEQHKAVPSASEGSG